MNIDELTIGQARQIAAMLNASSPPTTKPMIGEYVIVRCRDAGVHAGTLVDYEGRTVYLKESRRLWYWVCAESQHSLSGVAQEGIVHSQSKIPPAVGTIVLADACEIIETSEKCRQSIQGAPVYEVD